MRERLKVIEKFFGKATILDLLHLDLPNVLALPEDHKKVEREYQSNKFTDYYYTLREKELGVFDRLTDRIFNDGKSFNPETHTHITLWASHEPTTKEIVQTTDQLIQIYHEDDNGAKEIQIYEIDMLDKRDYWHGRTWNFNQHHGLWKMNHPEDEFFYSVAINYDSLEGGFCLSIFGYNKIYGMMK